MSLVEVECEILMETGQLDKKLTDLITEKGFYLRQLAGLVLNGSMPIKSASKLLVNY